MSESVVLQWRKDMIDMLNNGGIVFDGSRVLQVVDDKLLFYIWDETDKRIDQRVFAAGSKDVEYTLSVYDPIDAPIVLDDKQVVRVLVPTKYWSGYL